MKEAGYVPEALPLGEIIAKLRRADVLLGEGKKVPEVCKTLAIHQDGAVVTSSQGDHSCCRRTPRV